MASKKLSQRSFIELAVTLCLSVAVFGLSFWAGQGTVGQKILGSLETAIKSGIEAGNSDSAVIEEIPYVDDESVTLMFVGDIMLDRGVERKIIDSGKGDWKFPFAKSADYLKKADILFGNLESPISDKGYNVGSIYSFRADPKAVNALVFAGFDVVSLANNHALDYTRAALEDTVSRLRLSGILAAGAGNSMPQALEPKVAQAKGTKVAFVAFTNLTCPSCYADTGRWGLAPITKASIQTSIARAREEADIVVASFHYGNEYQKLPTDAQKTWSKLAIDSGADLVIGHHPHVTEPVVKYKNGWIAYSLGNFVFDQYFSEETMRGLLLEVKAVNGRITEVSQRKTVINGDYQPEVILQ